MQRIELLLPEQSKHSTWVLIGNKLKARAQKIWGNPRKLDASKPVTAAAKSESKMDAFAKEKWLRD
jgi:hypothetical protein